MIETWIQFFHQFLDKMGFSYTIHAALVYLLIGFVVGAFILRLIAFLFGRDGLALGARYCTILATLCWFPAVFLGFADWGQYYGRVWLPAIKVMMTLAGILFILLLAALYFEFGHKKTSKWVMLALYACCAITAIAIGLY
jgi:hypothetical protein